mmetsp:Transcript_3817/g.4405  ORF Transcript_3817/g.4405 Transcript_3817/m.4405 type:complete len:101 (+) Transcript_3817:195-497(+)|eukprot:CAMPEP_0194145414 /NCGR_PEP_ID=MMETSP0152-20130528/17414_1 /TAXON_ID=1049557 /ORGANISM="Thalassiothrix antarctica, Strain L6-D1" /LENGTH=100 /DNA_ID=CAMNT_0038845647 /DNA_START=178 /DNA_END=480 /DNA_ORIENTATION=+
MTFGIIHRSLDVLQKGAVLGLFSVFGFQVYQIGRNLYHGIDYDNHPQKAYVEQLRDKAEEEYNNYHKIDQRDWYDKDDNSYLDNAPKPDQPKKLKRFFRQ